VKTNVLVRDVIEQDLPIFFQHQLDPDANRMAAFPPREWDAFLAHWTTKIMGDETVTAKTILYNGQVAGNIVSWEHADQQEVGYWLGKAYWGKGIASQAFAAFLLIVKIRPLFAHVAKHNIASLRVLRKCGFTIAGEGVVPSDTADLKIEEFALILGTKEINKSPTIVK
jgi:RimJ/RimL family protein N-acetyltransferase